MSNAGRIAGRWPAAQARDWYSAQPWPVGCNFTPSTAINQLEMWQAETFDAVTIDRELGWAAGAGMNSVRVFLHDLLWDDAHGFTDRIEEFLSMADQHGISTMFVLFDDCWNDSATPGPQPAPVPFRHNSGWLQAPGHHIVADETQWPRLEAYVKGVVGAFADDERVLAWDIYNEPTNGFLTGNWLPREERAEAARQAAHKRGESKPQHLKLLDSAFAWARAAKPSQPLTAGLWIGDRDLNERLVAQSDVISFHTYDSVERLEELIARLRRHERPLICTEWLARGLGSNVATHLPVFERERVGCYMWGLVNGKTQTHIAWTHDPAKGEPELWFHDLLRADGSPYDPAEVGMFRRRIIT